MNYISAVFQHFRYSMVLLHIAKCGSYRIRVFGNSERVISLKRNLRTSRFVKSHLPRERERGTFNGVTNKSYKDAYLAINFYFINKRAMNYILYVVFASKENLSRFRANIPCVRELRGIGVPRALHR